MTTRKPAPRSVPVGPIRFDPELFDRLQKAAAADQRSMAAMVRIAVGKYLDWLDTAK